MLSGALKPRDHTGKPVLTCSAIPQLYGHVEGGAGDHTGVRGEGHLVNEDLVSSHPSKELLVLCRGLRTKVKFSKPDTSLLGHWPHTIVSEPSPFTPIRTL